MGTKIVKKSTVKPKKETTIARPKKDNKKVIIKAKKADEPLPEPESSEEQEELTKIPSDLSESESSGSESEAEQKSGKQTKNKKSAQQANEDESDDEDFQEELGGFSSTDESEDDEENDDEDSESEQEEEKKEEAESKKSKKQAKKESHEVKKLPKVDNSASKKAKKTKKGVIYIGRLPDGFEEKELSKYFNQFGEITNVKLARNKKTGRSKHFAFLEFANGDDAKIAQETMNNYLLMNHQLKVEIVNEEFKSSKKAKKSYFRISKLKKDVKTLNEKDQLKKQKRKDALKAAGINF